ncbi:hypothetical protein AB3N02_22730 [Priestia aryabhattai]|uniref:hypothetical protein n=1 Tax=Priestia aryabhattai TaxID=412384 RepID=UPI0039A3BA9D
MGYVHCNDFVQPNEKVSYDIILVNGEVLHCVSDDIDSIVEMMVVDDIFIIQENAFPGHTTYIMPEQVSRFVFPKDTKGVAQPR